jgi:hypothetical protein
MKIEKSAISVCIVIILATLVPAFLVGYWCGRFALFVPVIHEPGHLPLYDEITEIKERLTVTITEPNFTNPVRVCDFYGLREEDSGDYFQTTVNYWVFQHGQGKHGDIEAFVEIYNVQDKTDEFVIEITRNSWSELTVFYGGSELVKFPAVHNDTLSLGYFTCRVAP